VLGGCAGLADTGPRAPIFDPSLVSGERLFDPPLSDNETPAVGILEVDADMRDFVAASIRPNTLSTTRFHDLLQGMAAEGLTGPDYSADRTLTAAETFRIRTANCLSYTNLFIALARQAGLDAHYQVVDVPPEWDAQSGFLIRYTHINVLVRNVRLAEYYDNQVTVDFYEVHPAPYYRRRVVSDAYAESLYYANRAVNRMRAGDARGAFGYLRRAIGKAPENEDLWINLGAVYAMEGEYDSSVEAYEVALQIDSSSRAAMSGLARSHGKAGRTELAEFYRQRVDDYLEKNPYYYYAIARTAIARQEYSQSLAAIDRAIELNRRDGRFYFLKGLAEQGLGRMDAARSSFQEAKRVGLHSEAKLDYIRSLVGYNSH
jgi:tetratricopeptide (TPR) repeat protein